MPLIIPPGFAQAAFTFTGANGTEPYVTTLGLDTSAYGGDFANAARQAFAAYSTTLLDETSDDLSLDRVSLFIGDDGPSGSVDSDNEPAPGRQTAAFGPTAMSLIARKNTNFPGRRGRGRMFLPGTAAEVAVEEDGSVTPGQVTGVNGLLADFWDILTTGDTAGDPLPPVLFHSQAPADPTPITGFSVAPLVGWIRGRIR